MRSISQGKDETRSKMDYDKQIETLTKTRGLLQLINNSTNSIYNDLLTIKQNNQKLSSMSKDSIELLTKLEK